MLNVYQSSFNFINISYKYFCFVVTNTWKLFVILSIELLSHLACKGWQFRGSRGRCGCGVRAGGVGGSGGVTLSRTSLGGRHTRSSTLDDAVRRTSRASCLQWRICHNIAFILRTFWFKVLNSFLVFKYISVISLQLIYLQWK